jgi:2-polyprenyl-6-methoxyphenol hydroxylase-like FAD-dependent oxidoreductase
VHVTIVGGGIGGLTAALSLDAAGIGVRVLEATRRLEPLGAGINLLPHAVRELTELGLGAALADVGVPTAELIYHDCFGNRIWSEPRGLQAGYRWPQYSIHRGELQMLLLGAVRERLGGGAVRTGIVFEGFRQDEHEVRLDLRDRNTGGPLAMSSDVLVGADGIHSAVRRQLYPEEGPPIWNGIQMWRGVTEADPFLSGRSMIVAGSNSQAKFVAYPISRAAEDRGRAAVNWVAEVRLPPGAPFESGDWNRKGRVAEVLAHFASWRFEWLDIPALITGAPAVFEYPMVDRDPLPSWSAGRATLLGDAAHPMYPIGSNGASQAVIDGRVLAWELARHEHPVQGLAAYDATRRETTGALVLANREMGPEKVMRIVSQRAPRGFDRIEDVMSAAELAAVARDYKLAAGFEPDVLNSRPSWDVVGPGPALVSRP